MRIIVTGSIAFDYVMVFPGHFQDHILPEKMHILSVSFLVDSMKRLRGGTAPNIAYNLALLGERPEVVGTVGDDFADYRAGLESRGVVTGGIKVIEGDFTASCFINTDLKHNQITAFYPGAMRHAATLRLGGSGLTRDDLVLIAPNSPDAMAGHAAECTRLGIPYLYDPSMQAPRMTGEELEAGFRGAKVLTGNDYEFGMMSEKLGISEDQLRRKVPITVVTKGEAGALITVEGRQYEIPPASPTAVVDPTGAGDAYRAGLVKGMARGFSWPVTGRLGALTAVYAIEHAGTQNHDYTIPQFVDRYRTNFGPSDEVDSLLEGVAAA
jgi:adenosine kinase